MAVKAAAPKKVAAKKTVAAGKAAAPAKKTAATQKMAKGQSYQCSLCGLEVVVDEVCGCAEAHEIVCCDTPMRKKTSRAKAARK